MKAEDFEVGDEVICDKSYPNFPQKGWRGKVVNIAPYSYSSKIGIEWNKPFPEGHHCDGKGELGYCRYYVETSHTSSSDLAILKKAAKQLELFE